MVTWCSRRNARCSAVSKLCRLATLCLEDIKRHLCRKCVGLAANPRSLQQTFAAKVAQRVDEAQCSQVGTCKLYRPQKEYLAIACWPGSCTAVVCRAASTGSEEGKRGKAGRHPPRLQDVLEIQCTVFLQRWPVAHLPLESHLKSLMPCACAGVTA